MTKLLIYCVLRLTQPLTLSTRRKVSSDLPILGCVQLTEVVVYLYGGQWIVVRMALLNTVGTGSIVLTVIQPGLA